VTDQTPISPPSTIVFDTEPLVAHADGETGRETVSAYLDAVAHGASSGYLHHVNATEVRYVLARKYDRTTADQYLDWLSSLGINPTDDDQLWGFAADWVLDFNPALGDAYALATADRVDGTLLVGADDDYDAIIADTGVHLSIERFRSDGV
jgi:predicted nucleic acid-binding protein